MDIIGHMRNIAPNHLASDIRKVWSDEARESARLARQAGVKGAPRETDLQIGIKVAEEAVARANAKKAREKDARQEARLQARLRLTGYPNFPR